MAGKTYTSTVTRENRLSRRWIIGMNGAGCQEEYGTAHIFRTEDGRAALMNSRICLKAEPELSWFKPIDIAALCPEGRTCGKRRATLSTMPTIQKDGNPFNFRGRTEVLPGGYDQIRLVSLTAQRNRSGPSDTYGELVPPC
jgi:hypothetical protein